MVALRAHATRDRKTKQDHKEQKEELKHGTKKVSRSVPENCQKEGLNVWCDADKMVVLLTYQLKNHNFGQRHKKSLALLTLSDL